MHYRLNASFKLQSCKHDIVYSLIKCDGFHECRTYGFLQEFNKEFFFFFLIAAYELKLFEMHFSMVKLFEIELNRFVLHSLSEI